MNAVYAFQVTDSVPSEWFIDLKNGAGQLNSGAFNGSDSLNCFHSRLLFNLIFLPIYILKEKLTAQ